jgi:hypothetical protein
LCGEKTRNQRQSLSFPTSFIAHLEFNFNTIYHKIVHITPLQFLVPIFSHELFWQFGAEEIGLLYENNVWGLNIFKEFDELDTDLRVTGKSSADFGSNHGYYYSVGKFIINLANKDMKIVVLASGMVEMIDIFLDYLKNIIIPILQPTALWWFCFWIIN